MENTISFDMLSEANQREVERDSNEQYYWYAEPSRRGYRLHRIDKRQEQEPKGNWLLVANGVYEE
jgi:hypothetical protein